METQFDSVEAEFDWNTIQSCVQGNFGASENGRHDTMFTTPLKTKMCIVCSNSPVSLQSEGSCDLCNECVEAMTSPQTEIIVSCAKSNNNVLEKTFCDKESLDDDSVSSVATPESIGNCGIAGALHANAPRRILGTANNCANICAEKKPATVYHVSFILVMSSVM